MIKACMVENTQVNEAQGITEEVTLKLAKLLPIIHTLLTNDNVGNSSYRSARLLCFSLGRGLETKQIKNKNVSPRSGLLQMDVHNTYKSSLYSRIEVHHDSRIRDIALINGSTKLGHLILLSINMKQIKSLKLVNKVRSAILGRIK